MKPSGTLATRNSRKKAASALPTISLLKKYYPDAHCALDHETDFQLLIATILSAQCTDERVNQVTPHLFKKYPNALALSQAELSDVERIIHSTGFYKNKAKNIIACAGGIVHRHGGKVPRSVDQLIELGGVGRKTANVVLGNAYGIVSGIVVDTHVTRLATRLGWTKGKNAVAIERELQKIIPTKDWILISHLLIFHGRQKCKARKPDCKTCFLQTTCPSYQS